MKRSAQKALRHVASYFIGISLLLFAIVSAVLQRNVWVGFLETSHTKNQRLVQYGHLRRRMRVSFVVGCLGLGFSLNEYLQLKNNPKMFGYFWIGMCVLVLWLGVLGILEFIIIRFKGQRKIEAAEESHQALVDEIIKNQDEQESSE
jgi:hypothetical protein